MRDIPLVPERNVLEPDGRMSADDSRKPTDPLRSDRVALVWHCARALLPTPEGLLDLPDLGPRKVADLGRKPIERRGQERKRVEQLAMTIALQHLRRGRGGSQPQLLAGDGFDPRIGCGVGADGTRQLAHPEPLDSALDPLMIAVERKRPTRELEPKRRRLGVDPMRASGANGVAVLLGARHHGVERPADALEHERSGLLHRDRQGRIENVGRGEAVVEPATVLADALGHRIDEGCDVVVRLQLDLGNLGG